MERGFLGHAVILFSIVVTVLGGNLKSVEVARINAFNPPRPWIEIDGSTGGLAVAIDACQEDYKPCKCSKMSYPEPYTYIVVECNDVPSFEAVKSVFQRTTTQIIRYFSLTIPLSEGNNPIPADLLSGKATQWIELRCPNMGTKLNVDPKAFNPSQNHTASITFFGCDHSQLDYSFLNNFKYLNELKFYSSSKFSLNNFPFLPSLLTLSISASPDFEGFQNWPVSMLPAVNNIYISYCSNFKFLTNIPSVTMLSIDTCPIFEQWDVVAQLENLSYLDLVGLKNQTIHAALNSLVSSPLVSQLLTLSLYITDLAQVPPQIHSFSKLQDLLMAYNSIYTAHTGSFAFTSSQLRVLYFGLNKLGTIEPNAFQGNFSFCEVHLESNNLKRFESSVFKFMLEQMEMADSNARAFVSNNPFECDCHLAWLFRDNYHLLDRVYGGQCSNGTFFESLSPQGFASCPIDGSDSTTVIIPTTTDSVYSGAASPYFLQFFNRIVYLIIWFGFLSWMF